MRVLPRLGFILLLLLTATSPALRAAAPLTPQDVTLDFEDLPADTYDGINGSGQNIGLFYALKPAGPDFGPASVIFVSPGYNIDYYPPASGTNVVAPGHDDTNGTIHVAFRAPVSHVKVYYRSGDSISMVAYDASQQQIGTSPGTINTYPSDAAYLEITSDSENILSVDIVGVLDYFILDDFTYTTTDPGLPVSGDPLVETAPAIDNGDGTYTFQAQVLPHGTETTVTWDYGTDAPAYGQTTSPPVDAGSGNGAMYVSTVVSGLEAGALYHFRAVATNGTTTVYGDDRTINAGSGSVPIGPTASDDFVISDGDPVTFNPLDNDDLGSTGSVTVTISTPPSFGQATTDGTNITYTPDGTYQGQDYIVYTITDSMGQFSSATVFISADEMIVSAVEALKGSVPNAGMSGYPVPAGAFWNGFGIPGDDYGVYGIGKWKSPTGSGTGIFSYDGQVLDAYVGGPAPDESGDTSAGATFASFKDPVQSYGYVGFIGKMRVGAAGITRTNAGGVWAGQAGSLVRIAEEGTPAPGTDGAIFKSIASVMMSNTGTIFFTAKLVDGVGDAVKTNDFGIWSRSVCGCGGVELLLRTGETINTSIGSRVVKSFIALAGAARCPGDGRNDGGDVTPALVTFIDGSKSLLNLVEDTSGDPYYFEITLTGGVANSSDGSVWASFGFPAEVDNSGDVVLAGALKAGVGGATKQDSKGIFYYDGSAESIVRAGDSIQGLPGVTYSVFYDPAANNNGDVAWLSKLTGTGITGANNLALFWFDPNSDAPVILARKGDPAPLIDGATILSVTAVALPEFTDIGAPHGPLFVAHLTDGGSISKANDVVLYAVGADGTLTIVARTGDTLTINGTAKTLSKIEALTRVGPSSSQSRTYNTSPTVVYRASFTDRTSAVIRAVMPISIAK